MSISYVWRVKIRGPCVLAKATRLVVAGQGSGPKPREPTLPLTHLLHSPKSGARVRSQKIRRPAPRPTAQACDCLPGAETSFYCSYRREPGKGTWCPWLLPQVPSNVVAKSNTHALPVPEGGGLSQSQRAGVCS